VINARDLWFFFIPGLRHPLIKGLQTSAKDQIISEAARGVMQGASQMLQRKLRTVKVTLKGGHQLLLMQAK